jgi:hypothetical protein
VVRTSVRPPAQLANNYAAYRDADLADDIEEAANNVAAFITRQLPPESLIDNLIQLQFCIKNYQPSGDRWPVRLFGGAFFNKTNQPLPDKVGQCLANVATYHLLVINRKIPLAPKDWSL